MKYLYCLMMMLLFLYFSIGVNAQNEQDTLGEAFIEVEDMPSFPGGDALLYKYLAEHLEYPEVERDNGIEGLVVASFVVKRDGSISDIKILKGVTPNINQEAIRVIENMPNWNPGKQGERKFG